MAGTPRQPYFGMKGGWLTFWVTVACATDMMLFGYDQGVFGMSSLPGCLIRGVTDLPTHQPVSLSPRIS